MSRKDAHEGVSYADVATHMRWVGRTWNAHLRIALDLPMREGTGVAFVVRVAVWRTTEKGDWRDEGGVSARWPTSDAKTFAGLLLRLVYDLDRKLTEEALARAQRAPQHRLPRM